MYKYKLQSGDRKESFNAMFMIGLQNIQAKIKTCSEFISKLSDL